MYLVYVQTMAASCEENTCVCGGGVVAGTAYLTLRNESKSKNRRLAARCGCDTHTGM